MSIDSGWRDLAHYWIVCEKITLPYEIKTEVYNGKAQMLPVSIITRRWFDNLKDCMEYVQLGNDKSVRKDKLLANEYFKYYNTCELITFGNRYL